MLSVKNLSITRKLTLLMVAVSGVALLVAVVPIAANNYATLRSSKVTQLTALADVLASNSTVAMRFHQKQPATDLLASLTKRPTVKYACLFDNDGKTFASYRCDPDSTFSPSLPHWTGHRFLGNAYLDIALPVAEEDEVLGTIYLRATMSDLHGQLYRDAGIVMATVVLALAVAIAAAIWLQHLISMPIRSLATTAGRITEKGDYSIRVEPRSTDEIGELYRQFNLMLERIQASEDDLRCERDHSAGIIEGTSAAVYGVLPDGRASFVNPAWERIAGYRAKELAGRNYWELMYPGDQYRQVERFFRDLKRGEVRDYEMTLTTKAGKRRVIAWNSLKRCNENGDLVELVGFGNDITDRKRAEEERERLIVELETKNAELERFAYTVSHDLKTPLITIKCFLGLLEQNLAKADDRTNRDAMKRITGAADKMHDLLGQVLELSRVGRVSHPIEDVALGDLARDAVETAGGMLSESHVDIQIAPDLPVLRGDRVRLLEVLQNLLDNAVKYMGDQPEPRIEIGARHDDEDIVCYVRDNGVGIESLYHAKVFGLFDQLDQAATGSGVGLALVKRIIEVHGGRVWVESEGPGQGSTFCFTVSTKSKAKDAAASHG